MGRDRSWRCWPRKPTPISIHSPRMGRDWTITFGSRAQSISIHSPRMGRDGKDHWGKAVGEDFNPLSPHGERHREADTKAGKPGISIHSPRMGRDGRRPPGWLLRPISIHSPRMGRDPKTPCSTPSRDISIHSPRMGRDRLWPSGGHPRTISIHSPRMGRDLARPCSTRASAHFNPLSPHGERRARTCTGRWRTGFQSTLPAWGETGRVLCHPPGVPISIHTPRMGRDECKYGDVHNPDISIHSPRMGRDLITKLYIP